MKCGFEGTNLDGSTQPLITASALNKPQVSKMFRNPKRNNKRNEKKIILDSFDCFQILFRKKRRLKLIIKTSPLLFTLFSSNFFSLLSRRSPGKTGD